MQIIGIVIVALIVLALAACSIAPFILSSRIAKQEATPLEAVIAASTIVAHGGDCQERALLGYCDGCPFFDDDCNIEPQANVARARKWLKNRGLGEHA